MSLDANYPRLAPEAPRNARPEYVLELDDMQQFIVYGFKERHETRYVLLQITDAKAARAWLRAQLPPSQDPRSESPRRKHHVFGATRPRSEDEDKGVRVALAFTYLGLKVLGLDEATLSSFVPEFRQGMTEPHRARALGDEGRNSAERWLWGQWPDGEHPEHQVHVFCAAYAKTKAELAAWTRPSASNGFKEIDTVEATLNEHEPFGFRDGISQPYIKGSDKKAEKVPERDRIEAGEFVFGYPNEFGQFSESPRVAKKLDPDNILPPTVDSNFHDLGRNGTFLVVRELEQDVDGFEAEVKEQDAVLAVGRWKDGTPLVVRPLPFPLPPTVPAPPPPSPALVNDFTYFAEDAAGLRCPLGAHVRRANPRDALADPAVGVSPADAIELTKSHRILRRGRMFRRDGKRGIFFQCLNTNLERQFEFVQQAWVNNPKFSGPYEERDPLVGSTAHNQSHELTITAGPERERGCYLHEYVTVRGGAYFFLPGSKALRYLTEP